jgi:hypothetical protein
MHLIPPKFPDAWHYAWDDFDHLNWESIQDLYLIFRDALDEIVDN